MLDAQAELSDGGSAIVLCKVGDAGCENREAVSRGIRAGLPVCSRVAKHRVTDVEVVGERRAGGGIVDVVALHAFVEGSEAAAKNGSAVAEHVLRETDAGLNGVVVVLDQPSGESVLRGESHSVQVELHGVDGRDARAGGVDGSGLCPDGQGPGVVQTLIEVGDLV